MTATSNPFGNRPTKPQVVRLGDRRIAVFIGAAYEFTDDAGAASLRDQLDLVLQPSPREGYEEAELQARAHEAVAASSTVECGDGAPQVIASKEITHGN